MTLPVLECTNPWETECLCGSRWAPCWPRPDTACCDRLEPVDPTPEQTVRIERMLHVATEIIWRLSGKQFGGCPITVRPCRQSCADRATYGSWSGNQWMPILDGGTWYNSKCDKCQPSGCSCSELCEIDLPGPVAEILQVKQDGAVLDPELYRVDNARKLVRTGVSITDVSLAGELATNFVDATSTICTPVALSSYQDMNVQPGPTPPFCYVSDGVPGQRAVLQPGCQQFTITLAPGDTSPLVVIESGLSFTFPADGTLVPGAVFTVSNWRGDTRQKIRLVSGPVVPLVADQFELNTAGSYVFEVCFEQRVYGGSTACWPTCQELALPDTEEGTLSVRYRPGAVVPQGGLWAAGLLACQLLKACDEDAECALPANAQRIARQGVTVELTPVLIDRESGGFMTGIPEVDLWLESVNPYKAKMPSRVYSVDRPRPRTTTWPC